MPYIFDRSISFGDRCSDIFKYQIENNPIYCRFTEALGINYDSMLTPEEIPLLPIRGFKDGKIITPSNGEPELTFKSSGTSDMSRSVHRVTSQAIYETAILEEFQQYFPFDDYIVLFHLPGYEENPHSSLIWMAKYLIASDPSGDSQFVSKKDVEHLEPQFSDKEKKILLFGAAFGLMDILESKKFKPVNDLEILETGGMKTHRREMTKPELRQALSNGFEIPMENIHSEYGMCELLSQMYAIGSEWFKTPHWVQVSIRDPQNPSQICDVGEEGKIGIIDLANVYSCPFILTDDKGVMDESGRFKVLGRWNTQDLRGCNFLIDDE